MFLSTTIKVQQGVNNTELTISLVQEIKFHKGKSTYKLHVYQTRETTVYDRG